MKSPRKLGSLLVWLLASMLITITFRMAMTSTLARPKLSRHPEYSSRAVSEPSAHLLETALRKAEFPQMLNATERATLRQPIRTPNGTTFLPDHSLLVEAIPVVEDPNLTWDPCLVKNGNPSTGGNQNGAWTFNTLMLAIANTTAQNPQPAEQILTNIVADFAQRVTIGNFTAAARGSGPSFFESWPTDQTSGVQCSNTFNTSTSCLSLKNAPVHLNAIVNRIDIGQNPQNNGAGQLRFVFGVTMSVANPGGTGCQNAGAQLFNIIFEYNVPSTSIITGQPITPLSWAQSWAALSNDCPNGFSQSCAQGNQPNQFDVDLNNIVRQVVLAGAGGANAPNGSALADIRTNELELAGQNQQWEMRQFKFASSPVNGTFPLVEATVDQTPDLSFDFGNSGLGQFCTLSNQDPNGHPPGCSNLTDEVQALILGNQGAIENGTFSLAQVAPAAQAVTALNPPVTFWDSLPSMAGDDSIQDTRVIFAASPQLTDTTQGGIDGTCNGCHGGETQTKFQQIANRAATGQPTDLPSPLSGFLVGCNNGGTPLTAACPALTPGCGGSQNPCVFQLNSSAAELVQDPVFGSSFNNTFGDVERRVNCINKILGGHGGITCNGGGN